MSTSIVSLIAAAVALALSSVSIWMVFTIYRIFSKISISKDTPRLDALLRDLTVHVEESKRGQREGMAHIRHVGLVRFNPYPDTGGNQSFTLALLDGQHNGFVISSLHGREGTRIFAKKVRNGHEGEYQLSREERQAVREALQQ